MGVDLSDVIKEIEIQILIEKELYIYIYTYILINTVLPRLSGPRLSGRFSWDFRKKNALLFLSAEGKYDLQYVPPGFLGEVY